MRAWIRVTSTTTKYYQLSLDVGRVHHRVCYVTWKPLNPHWLQSWWAKISSVHWYISQAIVAVATERVLSSFHLGFKWSKGCSGSLEWAYRSAEMETQSLNIWQNESVWFYPVKCEGIRAAFADLDSIRSDTVTCLNGRQCVLVEQISGSKQHGRSTGWRIIM